MTEAAVLSTRDVPTAIPRLEQPRASLSPAQRQILEETWKAVEASGLLANGMKLFKHIFTICPPAQQMFTKMKDVTFNELEEDEVFRSHSLQVMETISIAISSLDDVKELTSVLQDLGTAHGPQGLKDAHFDLVGQALVATLEEGLGDNFTPDVKEAYVTFYQFVTQGMKEGLQEYESFCTEEAAGQ